MWKLIRDTFFCENNRSYMSDTGRLLRLGWLQTYKKRRDIRHPQRFFRFCVMSVKVILAQTACLSRFLICVFGSLSNHLRWCGYYK